MFCRSCWANLPDGTERCPKCERDPRVAVAAPASASPGPSGSPSPPGRPASGVPVPTHGGRLARLNAMLAAALALAVTGPVLVHWWESRREPPPGGSGGPVTAVLADARPEPSLPGALEPA